MSSSSPISNFTAEGDLASIRPNVAPTRPTEVEIPETVRSYTGATSPHILLALGTGKVLGEGGSTTCSSVWYCPNCGWGPLSPEIDVGCPNCGHIPKHRSDR